MPYKNNWIPTKDLEEMSKTNYDVLIIGTGFGGGTTLHRLCQLWKNHGDKKIGIIERGDKLFHSHSLNIPTQNVNTARGELLPDNSTLIGERLPQFPGARMVYALGGRSLFWNAATPRPIQSELNKWPINPRALNIYYSMAEDMVNTTTAYAKGSAIQDAMLNKLRENGIWEANHMPLAFDIRSSHQGEIHSNPWFSSINTLAAAFFDRSYDLAINAYASRIIVENGRTAGVEVFSPDKKAHILKSKNIVLSCGALETPRLLLNSGIFGPAIGRYLTDHVSIIAMGEISRRQFPDNVGNLSILKFETNESLYQIQILGPNQYYSYQQFEDKFLPDQLTVVYAAFGRTESRAENRVYVDPSEKDEFGVPLQQVQYALSYRDYQVANQMAQGIRQSADAMRVTIVDPTLILRPPGADMHESCSCRIGIDPATSATNCNGQVHGVQGLFVADNSALPSLSASGPVLSNIALSIRLADHIVSESRL